MPSFSPDPPGTNFRILIISIARQTFKTVSHFGLCSDFVTVGRAGGGMGRRTCFFLTSHTIDPSGQNSPRINIFEKWKIIYSAAGKHIWNNEYFDGPTIVITRLSVSMTLSTGCANSKTNRGLVCRACDASQESMVSDNAIKKIEKAETTGHGITISQEALM